MKILTVPLNWKEVNGDIHLSKIIQFHRKDIAAIKSLFYLSTSKKHACDQLPASADSVTLLAFAAERRPCSSRSISLGRRAHSSKPVACSGVRQPNDGTDGQTDRETSERSTVSWTYYASSVNSLTVACTSVQKIAKCTQVRNNCAGVDQTKARIPHRQPPLMYRL